MLELSPGLGWLPCAHKQSLPLRLSGCRSVQGGSAALAEGAAGVPPASTRQSPFDKYFMAPHLAPPPGYLSNRKALVSLPHAQGCEAGKHRKKVELDDWQVGMLCRSPMSFPVLLHFKALSHGDAIDHSIFTADRLVT